MDTREGLSEKITACMRLRLRLRIYGRASHCHCVTSMGGSKSAVAPSPVALASNAQNRSKEKAERTVKWPGGLRGPSSGSALQLDRVQAY